MVVCDSVDVRCCAAGTFLSFQLNGVKSLKRYLHYSSEEEDDFSELGSPVGQGGGTVLKLMTEKPEPFKKSVSARKASSCSSGSSESSRRLKDAFWKPSSCASAPHHKAETNVDIFKSKFVNRNASNFKSSSSVTIENVPSVIQLTQLKEALSTFGKISNVSMRTVPNGLDCCDIQFESVESRDRALSVGRITVKNFNLPIHPLHVFDVVTIRIYNISSESADSAIHSMCMSCGPLEALAREKEDAVDALFTVKDKSDTQIILEKLNNTMMDDCKWSAHLQNMKSTSLVKANDDDAQWHLGLKFCNHLEDLKRQICSARVCSEDLEFLHHAILHLQCHPATGRNLSNID